MYRKEKQAELSKATFALPSEWRLCENNRWVVMAGLIPWSEFEEKYAKIFSAIFGSASQAV